MRERERERDRGCDNTHSPELNMEKARERRYDLCEIAQSLGVCY